MATSKKKPPVRKQRPMDLEPEEIEPEEINDGEGQRQPYTIPTPPGLRLFGDLGTQQIAEIQVYRIRDRSKRFQGRPELQNLEWNKDTFSQKEVARVLGGGIFLAVASDSAGEQIGAVEFSIGGPPREPGPSQAQVAMQPAHETPGGWVSIPGLDPSQQLAFSALQQVQQGARQDALNAMKSKDVIMTAVIDLLQNSMGAAITQMSENLKANNDILRDMRNRLAETEKENMELRLAKVRKQSPADVALEAVGPNLPGLLGVVVKGVEKVLEGVKPTAAFQQAFQESAREMMQNQPPEVTGEVVQDAR